MNEANQWILGRLELSAQQIAKFSLMVSTELRAVERQVENVDGTLAFGINQSHFEIAAVLRERGRDLIKQAGMILRCDFHQG